MWPGQYHFYYYRHRHNSSFAVVINPGNRRRCVAAVFFRGPIVPLTRRVEYYILAYKYASTYYVPSHVIHSLIIIMLMSLSHAVSSNESHSAATSNKRNRKFELFRMLVELACAHSCSFVYSYMLHMGGAIQSKPNELYARVSA